MATPNESAFMKPDFALSLSADGIELLQRLKGGWYLLETINPSDPDLAGHMAQMQALATSLSPSGLRTKLIIPNDQIKYITAPINATNENQRLEQVQAALEGATPYTLDELSYDWNMHGTNAQIAAVAHETLAEAEAFATDFNFAPVCFVGAPDTSVFGREPFFGMTQAAASILPAGETAERDLKPIVVIGPVPSPLADDTVAQEQIDLAVDKAAPNITSASVPEREDTPTVAFSSRRDTSADLPTEPSLATGKPLEQEPERRITFAANPDIEAETAPKTGAVVPPLSPATSPNATAPKPLGTPNHSLPDAAPAAPTAFAEPTGTAPIAPPVTGVSPAAQGASPQSNFVPQREDALPSTYESAPATNGPAQTAPQAHKGPGLGAKLGGFASGILATRKAKKEAKQQTQAVVENEAEKFTVFGARKPKNVGGKPKFLGLILTGVLLLFLALIALMSANWDSPTVSWLFGRDADTRVAGTAEPVEIPDAVTIQAAATDIGLAPAEETQPILSQPQSPTVQDVQTLQAQSGIWTQVPNKPELAETGSDASNGLYLASIDPVVGVADAVALPSPRRLLPDSAFDAQKSPLGADIRFQLNALGLVVATADGALSPEGFRVFSGRPSSIPPQRPAEIEVALVQPTDPRVIGVRPKTRPSGIFEKRQRDLLGGYTRAELAALRPSSRPKGLTLPSQKAAEAAAKAQAEAEAKAKQAALEEAAKTQDEKIASAAIAQPPKPDLSGGTSRAVSSSPVPKTRPKNFARTAARIFERAEKSNETKVVAVAPRTVKPSGSINGTVARNATMTNALNMRKVNLIGVYGKTSSRQAMVRLKNGRYVKVKAGDRLDGGRVAAIGESQLRYVKNGRNITLKMPRS